MLREDFASRINELAIHKAVETHLRQWAWASLFWWHTPNGEKRDPAIAAKLKAMGVKPGISDYMFIWCGRLWALEIKANDGELSEEQAKFGQLVRSTGGEFAVVYSFEAAVAQLEAWGMLRIKVASQLPR